VSGLAALLLRDGRTVARAMLEAMLQAVPYRGPDEQAVVCAGSVGLGHAKLAVTPEDVVERQPIVSPRSGCMLAADARLDNRAELLAALPGSVPRQTGDAELILRAYETWGLAALRRLLGDFALVLWDPVLHRLVCARDSSGQRTLVYRDDGRTFAAASDVRQLLQDPHVPVQPDDERIRHYLVPFNMRRNEAEEPETFFRGIRAVPAGHALVLEPGGSRLWRYWQLEPPDELRYRSEAEYAEHFRALLFDVVESRLRSAGPLGALLSGGLDSSSLVCTAQELYRGGRAVESGFITFTFSFGGLDCDETDLVREIQAKYDFDARLLPLPPAGNWLRPEPEGFQESPNAGLPEMRDAIFGAAAAAGVRALLSGDIADSCVGGSPLIFDALLRHRKFRLFRRHLETYRRGSSEPLRSIVAQYCVAPLLPLPVHRAIAGAYARRRLARLGRRLTPTWLTDTLRADLHDRQRALALQAERARRFSSPAREWEFELLYPPEAIQHPAPWPVEVWRPFADRRLHTFLLAVPPDQKFAAGLAPEAYYTASKQLVRRAMVGVLPESVRTRVGKTVFNSVVAETARRHWATFEAAFGPGARSELAERGYVDPARFWTRLELLRDGLEGADAVYLVKMIALESWLRTFRLPREQLVAPPRPVNAAVGAG
jgi:asparagine synthase (glutamine-hydrolysing)